MFLLYSVLHTTLPVKYRLGLLEHLGGLTKQNISLSSYLDEKQDSLKK